MVSELENNIVSGLILVVVVLMAFLGFRNSVFVAVAIPLSMLISFVVVQMIGYSLNMMVLTREVAMPVIASTVTTLCAFAPMLIWPGIIGDFMSYLPVTLIIALSASLLVALVFNPTLCAYLMKPPPNEGVRKDVRVLKAYRRLLEWVLEPAADEGTSWWFLRNWALPLSFVAFALFGVILTLGATLLEIQSALLFGVVAVLMAIGAGAFVLQGILWLGWNFLKLFTGWTAWVTDRRSGVIWSMGVVFAVTVGAYYFLGKGMKFFPEMQPRQVFVDVEAPSGSTLETSDGLVARVEGLTRQTKDLEHTIANVGSTGISIEGGAALGGGGSSVSNRKPHYARPRRPGGALATRLLHYDGGGASRHFPARRCGVQGRETQHGSAYRQARRYPDPR